ncbi:MAG: peptidylprolyl isomerase [Elusimicrobia bacterium]|nr:peptidylprolyl isomerase [Elusimicrobiota bacterium]
MRKNTILVWILGFVLMSGRFLNADSLGVGSSPEKGGVVGRSVAVVNNEPIFQDELEKEAVPFIERYRRLTPEKDFSEEKIGSLKKEILDRLIEEKLLLQEAKSKKIRITKVEVEKGIQQFKEPFLVDEQGRQRTSAQVEKNFQEQLSKEGMTQEQFQKRVEEQLLKVRLIDMEIRSKVAPPKEEENKKFFEKIRNKMSGKPVEVLGAEEENDINQIAKFLQRMTGEQARVRHILVRSNKTDETSARLAAKQKADEILQKVKSGEDFAFLAKKFSDEPMSRERGGDLGFIAKGDLGVPVLEETIFKLKEGESSKVIESDFGYHLVKMVEKKSPHPLDYEEVSDDLKNFLAQKSFTQKMEKYLQDLRSKSSIKISSIQ